MGPAMRGNKPLGSASERRLLTSEPQPFNQRTSESGFSLPDVLASLLILSIAALALTKSTVTSLSSAKRGVRSAVASHLAHNRMEELLAVSPQSLTAAHAETATPLIERGMTFVRSTTLTIEDDGTRIVTVSVKPVPSELGSETTLNGVFPLWGKH